MHTDRTRPTLRGISPATLVLVLGTLLSVVLAGWVRRAILTSTTARLETDAAKIHHDLAGSLQTYEEVMVGARGLVRLHGDLDLRTFRAYIQDLDLLRRHRGLLSISYGYFLEPDQVPAFQRRLKAEWAPLGVDARVTPPGDRPLSYVVAFVEPLETNRELIGVDTLTRPGNRESLEAVRLTGKVVSTAPMRVVQYAGPDPAMILRLGVFQPGSRRAVGCVNCVFRTQQLVEDALGEAGLARSWVSILDRGTAEGGTDQVSLPVYSASEPSAGWLRRLVKPCPETAATFERFGRRWEVRVGTRRSTLGDGIWLQPLAAGGAGILATLLLAGLLQAQARVLKRARRLAGRMTLRFREAERELQRSRADYAAVLESTQDLVCSVDLQGRLRTLNSALAEHFRHTYGAAPVLGEALTSYLPPGRTGPWPDLFRRVLEEGSFQTIYALDEDRVLELAFHPIREEGRAVGITIFGKDITAQRRAEAERLRFQEQLYQSQKMDAIGQLAGGIAHDFNNMLMGILGAVEVIQTGGERQSPKTRQRFLDIISSAANRASELTGKLLTAARKAEKSMEVLSLPALVRDTMALLERTLDRRVTLRFEDLCRHGVVVGDASQLSSVFMNLGVNAGQAMPEGGELTFRVSEVELDAPFCAASPFGILPGDFVQVEVMDTGCGIPREVVGRIFEPFFTTKGPGQGTGLGLAAAYGTLQDHLGAIQVESEPGRGTTFRVFLPLSEAAAPSKAPAPGLLRGAGRVLVVDDEEILRATTRSMLEELGYEVLEASDGAEGLARFRETHETLAAVVLDMIMPVMGGRQAFEGMREIDPGIPVILASGFSRDADLDAMRNQGLAAFLQKPYRLADLGQALGRALAR